MASTDTGRDDPGAAIAPLADADLAGALALSASAQWNQNEADWRGMLALGRGWGVRARDDHGMPALAASVIVLPYGKDFAWMSMVLVLPAFRRRGYASLLLRHALGELAKENRSGVLDATPAGHEVYVQEGFRDTWGFARYRREGPAAAPDASRSGHAAAGAAPAAQSASQNARASTTRALSDVDWPAIEALDSPVFGASRVPLLRTLAQRLPQAARVAEGGGRLRGFVLGRDGREARQIGPLVAEDEAVARALLADVLPTLDGPLYVDLLDRRTELRAWLGAQGFALQRPFTRMVHGRESAPGDAGHLFLVAGPELG